MAKDDLEHFIAERSEKNKQFPEMIKAAEQRRALARQLSAVRRSQRDLSQTKLAATIGSSPSIISRLENGADVRLSTLQKYAAALNCDLKIELIAK